MSGAVNAVEAKDLTKRFGKFTAVERVNFYIPRGEIFGLLGPNGAGKTTTIRMLCGLMLPDGGNASVLGFDIAHKPEEIKKRIGYMSQKFSLYNDLSAAENLNFYAAIYSVPAAERKKRVEALIEMAGLKGYERELTQNLSGAWRQRLALACAIVHRPLMLFLDEATAGVDPVSRREFWDLIYSLAAEGVSVLATTHYMDEADYCNTIGMMYQGELIALASPDRLKDEMPGWLLQVDCDRPGEALTLLEGLEYVRSASVHGTQLHAVLTQEDKAFRVKRALEAAGLKVRSAEIIQPSLEDAFIAMVAQHRENEETNPRKEHQE